MSETQPKFPNHAQLIRQKLDDEGLLCVSDGQVPNFDSYEEAMDRAKAIIAECLENFAVHVITSLTATDYDTTPDRRQLMNFVEDIP